MSKSWSSDIHPGFPSPRQRCGCLPLLNIYGIALLLLLTACTSHAAGEFQGRALTLYAGQGVDSNLMEIIPDTFGGDLEMEDTWMVAIGYSHLLDKPDWLQKTFDILWIPQTQIGLEGLAAKHFGLQHHWEADTSFYLRFAGWEPLSLRIRPGLGMGFSYAFSSPSYEDGPRDDPERRYRFQNYNFYELEWSLKQMSRWAFVTRIHHRSGIYGIIAPRHVGSNFLTLGLRYGF